MPQRYRLLLLPIVAALGWALMQFVLSSQLGGLRERSFDFYQTMLPKDVSLDQVALVTIDEQSLAGVGRWPWPRAKVGEIIDLIGQSGAAAIGLDILFPEPDGSATGAASDAAFAQALKRNPTVLAMSLTHDGASLNFQYEAGFSFIGDGTPPIEQGYPGGVAPILSLIEAASGLGVIRSFSDDDGRMRAIPLIWADAKQSGELRYWPSFSMDLLRVAQDANSFTARIYGAPDDAIKIGQIVVPLADGRLRLIDAPTSPLRVSAATLLADGPQQALENRIVILALDAVGLDAFHLTARGSQRLGPELHAIAIGQMLNGQYLERVDNAAWRELVLFALLAAIMIAGFVLLGRTPILATTTAFFISAIPLALGFWYYAQRNVLLDAATPTVGLLLTGLVGGYALYQEAERKRVSLQKQFSQFLSPEVVKRLAETDSEAALAVEDRMITVMLLDVRGFTKLSEEYGGKRMVDVMNHFFGIASDEIFRRGGTIDKFMGDAVLAFWNAPLAHADHADRAFDCAQAILDRVARENRSLKVCDLPEIRIVAVLETGLCSVGNMGTKERIDYTAIGPAVNLASRLEKYAKDEGHLLVTGPQCAAQLSQPLLKVAKLDVRGFDGAVEVFVP